MGNVLEGSWRGGLVEYSVDEEDDCAVLFELVGETTPLIPVVDHSACHGCSLGVLLAVEVELESGVGEKTDSLCHREYMFFPVPSICCNRHECDDFGAVVCRGADFFKSVEDFRAGRSVCAVGRVDEDGGRVPGLCESVGVG